MPETLMVGDRPIAVERRAGRAPGLFWLSGFRSDMTGSKALAVDAYGASHGLGVTRFDYSGHGQSGGDFNQGTISRWLEETLAVFDSTAGPQIVVGSSMGGWLALLLAQALRSRGERRIAGMVLVAPAVDMTELMLAQMPKKYRKLLDQQGYVDAPSDYSTEPYRINKTLIDDGQRHLLFGHAIEVGSPIAILQGAKDRDVPRTHAERLLQHLLIDSVTFTLIPDGEHRLSRPQDLAQLNATIAQVIEGKRE